MTEKEYNALKESIKTSFSNMSDEQIASMLHAENHDPSLGDYSSVG